MEVINQIYPSDPEQIEQMMMPGPEGPIVMVNLLKFRSQAIYPDGRPTELTGQEAYRIYAEAVSELLGQFGGKITFSGNITHLTLGKVDDLWDQVALVEYPNRAALVAMSTSEAYATIGIHREAGLEGQLNIETTYADLPGES